ncbi:hypothetical protein Acr_20g0006030 [Actinidia rufa]|uniref:Uncharacterized protein n=1 Tax=Actinidia rufa TaxID=165716 RepID=A0A7J0GD96_9ERIC|nr:hypothetical protein Acr_20g0006030 [Actinidia rufa]
MSGIELPGIGGDFGGMTSGTCIGNTPGAPRGMSQSGSDGIGSRSRMSCPGGICMGGSVIFCTRAAHGSDGRSAGFFGLNSEKFGVRGSGGGGEGEEVAAEAAPGETLAEFLWVNRPGRWLKFGPEERGTLGLHGLSSF